jgi:uncharacterized membrane protein YhiD involved in acid resistance
MVVVAEILRRGGEVKMISSGELILRLVVAGVLGALVGLERERLEWAAGMRTHALVSLGSALFMVVSIFGFMDILDERHVILDPSRVAAQVASGIGFIGAGTIIFRREIVKGLTTAASIWAVAAVGLAVGGGMFLAAVSATLLSLACSSWPGQSSSGSSRTAKRPGASGWSSGGRRRWPTSRARSRPQNCPWSA